MQTLKERWRPKTLGAVVGQPAARQLAEIVRNPRPQCILLEGPTGCGKSTCAQALAHDMGCSAEGAWMESVYTLGAGEFNADAVKYWFGPESPFRYVAPGKGYHVLILEELEYMHPTVQVLVKDSFERKLNKYKLIVVATSNDSSKLVKAVRHRFDHYFFSAGADFAAAVNDWLPTLWAAEVGEGVEMPYGWQQFGWDGEEFSARLAMDRLQKFVMLEHQASLEVLA